MLEPMRRGRSRILWRYTPHANYRYSDSGPWCSTAEIIFAHRESLDGALAGALETALRRWGVIDDHSFPDPLTQPSKYVTGEPGSVFFSLWPLVFQCTAPGCGTVHYYKDLDSLRSRNEMLRCRECHATGHLKQIPYVFVCECGRIETPFVPSCKRDGQHAVQLVDRKGFRESFWRCKVCRTNLIPTKNAGLGFRLCPCGNSMHGRRLDDPQSYHAQTLNIVAVDSKALDAWRQNASFEVFLTAAALEAPAYEQEHINELATRSASDTESQSSSASQIRASLEAAGIGEDQIVRTLREMRAATGTGIWREYGASIAKFEKLRTAREFAKNRQTIEYVFVRDDRSSAPVRIEELRQHAFAAGDSQAAERYCDEMILAQSLGIRRLTLVQELPLILAAYGYTRFLSDPYTVSVDGKGKETRARLRAFELIDDKLPIFTAKNTTEGLLFEMDPATLAAFICVNLSIPYPSISRNDVPGWKAWLIEACPTLFERGESHLRLHDIEARRGQAVEPAAALLFGVVHSMSHALKSTAHKFVGIDGDGLAEYLFPAYGAALIYASANVQFTLGGIDSVFRSNMTQWLGAVRDYAGLCSFDPVCSHEGGACHACMYPKFGCQVFNRTVSRAFLVGGIVDGWDAPISGLWSGEVAELAAATST